MIELPKDHSDPLVVGVGRHKVCYIHPEDPRKCIKVIYNPDPHAFQEIKREVAYYRRLEKYLKDWSGLPRFYGEIDTNFGIGYVYDRIIDFDGRPSETMDQRYRDIHTKASFIEEKQLVDNLEKYLLDNHVVTMTLKPYNILCHRISRNKFFPVICDNIGVAAFIPLVCPWYARITIRHSVARFRKDYLKSNKDY